MLKLNAGFSRKIGEPNYGSRGASVNVELEVESNLIGDPDAAVTALRQAYGVNPDDEMVAERLRQHGLVPGPTVALPHEPEPR